MSLRSTELASITQELERGLTGAFAQKARAVLGPRVELELRQPGRSTVLVLSAEAGLSRLSVRPKQESAGGEPLPLQKWLRQELVGAQLVGVTLLGPRLVALRFARPEKERRLWLELARGPGRLVLTDGEGKVLASTDGQVRAGGRFPADVDNAAVQAERSRSLNPRDTGSPFDSAQGEQQDSRRPGDVEGRAAASPSRLLPPDDGEPFPLARAAESLFGETQRRRQVDELRKRLGATHRARLSRVERTREKVQADAERLPKAHEHRLFGELLTQNLGRIPRGAPQVRLTHYAEEGPRELDVPLDPKRSAKELAEWHFHQYRRLLRGVEHAQRRLAELDAEAAQARAALTALEQLGEEELRARHGGLSDAAAHRPRKGPQRARPFREYRGAHGERILVGKGGADNDALTFHVARPHDLWLHALGVQGAHVVVPLERDQLIPQELLIDAAHLALHASRDRSEPSGEVAYTQAKFVRRPKGAAPGAVTYSREKVLRVRLEPARLARLLKSAELLPEG